MTKVTLNNLYDLAEKKNIAVECFEMRKLSAMSYMDESGKCYIGIDPFQLKSSADEKVKLAHDMGHCITGAFYNKYSNVDDIGRHEYKSDKWAVHNILPFEDIKKAMQSGLTEAWQLAEYFDLTEEFIFKAIQIYENEELNA